jgi:hypothetical protein
LQASPAAPGDPAIDWSGVTKDLLGHDLDPSTDVQTMAVAGFQSLSEDEVMEALFTDSLEQSDVTRYVNLAAAGATSARLDQLTRLGTGIDVEQYFVESSATWLLLLSDSLDVGIGVRMLAFLEPDFASKESTALLSNDDAVLTLDVKLDKLDPVRHRG